MDEKEQDFCEDDKPCTDCGQTRRGFLGKATKIGAGLALAAAGIVGGDRKLEALFGPKLTPPSPDVRDAFLRSDPAQMPNGPLRDAVLRHDADWIDQHVRVEHKPGQAGAICSGCAYTYYTGSSAQACNPDIGCHRVHCCYQYSGGGSCVWTCQGWTDILWHCGRC
jgi:hypothetical protein